MSKASAFLVNFFWNPATWIVLVLLLAVYSYNRSGSIEELAIAPDAATQEEALDKEVDTNNAPKPEVAKEEEDNKKHMQAGAMYAELVCILSEPSFWEKMFDGETQTEDEVAFEEQKMELFYKTHNYNSEVEAKVALELSWGNDVFTNTVKEHITSACPAVHTNPDIHIEDILNSPLTL